jgi:hypothetical protein
MTVCTYKSTRRYNPQDHIRHLHRRENTKSQMYSPSNQTTASYCVLGNVLLPYTIRNHKIRTTHHYHTSRPLHRATSIQDAAPPLIVTRTQFIIHLQSLVTSRLGRLLGLKHHADAYINKQEVKIWLEVLTAVTMKMAVFSESHKLSPIPDTNTCSLFPVKIIYTFNKSFCVQTNCLCYWLLTFL